MPKREPVNIVRQMIFAVIPFLDIYASYKIQKLRWWFLVFWVSGTAIGIIYDEAFYDGTLAVQFFNSFGSVYTLEYLSFAMVFFITQASVMRIWSKRWNEQIKFDVI